MHTYNSDIEKSPGRAALFNIWTIWVMDGTSAQPQVNLSLLRSNSFKFQPQVIVFLAWQIRIVLVNIKFFCKKQSPNCNLPWLLLDGSTVLIWWMLKCWMTTRVNTNPSKLTTTACSGNHISFFIKFCLEKHFYFVTKKVADFLPGF